MRKKRQSIARLLALAVAAAATIVFTATRMRPVFLDARIGGRLIPAATPDEKAMLLAPWSRLPFHEALATPVFLRDRSAFALDLLGTGKVGLKRALALADVAVRESYRRRVPPALVLGVMLTENDQLKSTARSRQGAIGLMQIHPGPWRSALGDLFGRNLRNDTTNLRYGIYILSHFAKRTARTASEGAASSPVDAAPVAPAAAAAVASPSPAWRTALLRYNGCVRGRNTPDCGRYPEMVRREVAALGAHHLRRPRFRPLRRHTPATRSARRRLSAAVVRYFTFSMVVLADCVTPISIPFAASTILMSA